MSNLPLLRTVELTKSYFRGTEVPVLRGVSLSISAGEVVSIVGTSGSGKSTLLHLIGGLDLPDSGEVIWKGEPIDPKNRRFRDKFRNESVGYIFQFYHLLPELSALENVMLPALIRLSFWRYYSKRSQVRQAALELLDQVGLSHRSKHRPSELSGGEMQRAAIARALMAGPELLLADEPTGNLDFETGIAIQKVLFEVSRQRGVAVLLVTHDQQLAAAADRKLRLNQGVLVDSTVKATAA